MRGFFQLDNPETAVKRKNGRANSRRVAVSRNFGRVERPALLHTHGAKILLASLFNYTERRTRRKMC